MASRTPAPRQQTHLAVLIDADNAPAAIVEGLFEEIAKYGIASVKRIYGDWTKPQLGKWKQVLLDHSIQPMQQFAYTSGKNATDSALIIDAMDLLYTRRFDGFCLVSSDSDFTRLAARLREEGLTVYGFGEEKTPKPFVSACDKFIYTEILRASPEAEPAPSSEKSTAANVEEAPKPAAKPKPQKVPLDFIAKVLDDIADEDDDWVHLGALGQNISKLRPAFDPRLYGFKKLSDLIKGHPKRFELQARGATNGGSKDFYVRNAGIAR
ncbi:NYN domain-containing protein [Pseudomonas sp. ZM23]|uniref:NYN domain-containing protein n=1 Tax=Pseudomonas triclosanedens TaxID=2961893 RepID=A0ABY6ZYB4_9PSED|nr:NYN domain-containing protein [Pseudomonas triclosanedens]MCP8462623.1 NYN domain-containing protein [Pseudomonas triclosanedens]MCP8468242.1 NYN domain-containing protein [Pseudomonas triclosanedens]MCP8475001.1 NYN domain-containing protein [Pseudomonas triclosanedens]WAI49813.1 NYN domain-containing protein [Pseudomonas triclosanedens]